jgi:hypothetical protein
MITTPGEPIPTIPAGIGDWAMSLGIDPREVVKRLVNSEIITQERGEILLQVNEPKVQPVLKKKRRR